MKRTTILTLSIFLMTGIGFAQNIKTIDKSKAPKHYGEMMMKLDNQYSQKDLENLKKELEESKKQQKAETLLMTKYPQFTDTIAEEYIKTELAKNPNWEIKGVYYNGVEKKFVMEPSTGGYYEDTFLYTFITTSGNKVITCEDDYQSHEIAKAVSKWASEVMKAKYPEFTGTIVEDYIKVELGKNIDWKIENISFAKKEFANVLEKMIQLGGPAAHHYILVSTSGEYYFTTQNKNDNDKMQAAIKTWKNKK